MFMEAETITQEIDSETRLQRAFARMIEIKHQKNLLEQEESVHKLV